MTIPVHTAESRKPAHPRYAPLWLYDGAWDVSRKSADQRGKPDRLVNECARLGKYFACAQTVNGNPGGLIIFIPAAKPGAYSIQNITVEGRATGLSQLNISGDQWIYSSRWPQDTGKILYYRTTNLFTGKNRIHFEQAESSDGNHWTVKETGDEIRVTTAHIKGNS
jgi:hypothetical protein